MKNKVTVGLNMIVRNEFKVIERCLNSLKDHIDYFTIIDTGSTDSTKQIINDFFNKHKINGVIYDREWVNFEVNRTEALKLAKGKTDYILLIDADMELMVNDIDWKDKISYDTCLVQQDSGICYYNTRLINGNLNYKYTGVTHEYIECLDNHTSGRIDSIAMIDYADGGTRNEKYERDIKLLLKGIEENPSNARYHFYLANSYRDLGQKELSIQWYKKRIGMGGWKEEVWNSFLNIGRCYQSLNNWTDALEYYLKAYNYHQGRAESIYEISKYYRENNMPVLGYHFATMGMKIPYPKDDVLFIEKAVYEYLMKYELSICACYVGDLKMGRISCDELIFDRNTPEYIRISCLDNLYFYLEKLENTTIEELVTTKTKDNYNFCNPSIINSEKGIWVNIREVSYNFNINDNIYNYDKTIDTHNHLINLSSREKGILTPITETSIKTYNNYITGLEDIRLFEHNEELWGIGTCRTTNPEGINEMVAVKINLDYSISNAVRLKGYKDSDCQKNWVPINYNGYIHFLYSSDPLILLKPDFETGKCEVVINKSSKYRLDNFRGSSQVIPFNGGYLYVVHEVIHRDGRRYYYHRFVYMYSNLEVVKISDPFYFIDKTIEYCAGIAEIGNTLYVTIGYEDKKAYLIKVPRDQVIKSLKEI